LLDYSGSAAPRRDPGRGEIPNKVTYIFAQNVRLRTLQPTSGAYAWKPMRRNAGPGLAEDALPQCKGPRDKARRLVLQATWGPYEGTDIGRSARGSRLRVRARADSRTGSWPSPALIGKCTEVAIRSSSP